MLAVKLDNIFLGKRKIHVNVPKPIIGEVQNQAVMGKQERNVLGGH